MTQHISDQIKLYGTDQPVEPMQTLTAGPVSCQFDQGALRFIKINGHEAIRNISFVVRDKDWGTYLPSLSNLRVDQQHDSFTVEYDAVCKDDHQEIHYRAKITGSADGYLSFTGAYTTVTDFLTNRTGFVVLHPIRGVAGHPVTVEHTNGDIRQSGFPELVDPIQPFKDIRALTHEVSTGINVCCRMTGDTFEMEDHRQWNDASYKTYVRPLALPWPYTIPASESAQQAVTLTVRQSNTVDENPVSPSQPCLITISKPAKVTPMPQIGLGLKPQHLASAAACQDLLKEVAPQQLVVWHELEKHTTSDLKQAAELARSINANTTLHAVIADNDFKTEIAGLAAQCHQADFIPQAISVTPAMYLKSIMPGSGWPEVTGLADIYDETRENFPDAAIGGGMLSFFPELNRHRPPVEHLDFITHASNTITHACDDITVTENLEALPYIIKTCRSFAADKPYHIGPASIGMRFNPYGSKTMDNPDNERIAMARMDPRQRGLINAAWTVGYVAHLTRGGVDCINLHGVTGEFGIIPHRENWPMPGFDNTHKKVFPVFPLVADFARATQNRQLLTHSTMSREVEAVACENDDNSIVWIANLSGDSRHIEVAGIDTAKGRISTLSLESFDLCTDHSNGFELTTADLKQSRLLLTPYSVIRITVPHS